MKFESKFGIGEICDYNPRKSGQNRHTCELLVRVIAITFEVGSTVYLVEYVAGGLEIRRFTCYESDLSGDPDFDQVAGKYPDEA